MDPFHRKVFFVACLLPMACSGSGGSRPSDFRLIMEQIPATLNPRASLDATGQRLGSLLYRGLTRLDADLVARPDLAESWQVSKDGLAWTFRIRAGAVDHGGETIDSVKIAACLESYRKGKPTSTVAKSFTHWKGTRSGALSGDGTGRLVIELAQPDPYLARNLTLLRYFRSDGATPCSDPTTDSSMIGSGPYRPENWDLTPETELRLLPHPQAPHEAARRPIHISFTRDETTRALKLLRGETDAAQNTMTLTKTRWFAEAHADQFRLLERDGVSVSYLAFNLADPVLSRLAVRKAIAKSIDREAIVDHKMMGFGTVAGSLLSPRLNESKSIPFAYDPEGAKRLLDQAGFPPGKNGIRLILRYKTTPVREGFETALLFREMLSKVGIELKLEIVEPAVFLTLVRKGAYQLHSSRWIGVSDGSILFRTLHSDQPNNRWKYRNPEMDRLLEAAMKESDEQKRIVMLGKVQETVFEDLPYFPLWFWKNAMILRKGYEGSAGALAENLSLSGGLDPLMELAR